MSDLHKLVEEWRAEAAVASFQSDTDKATRFADQLESALNNQWQPIETAPESTEVLTYGPRDMIWIATRRTTTRGESWSDASDLRSIIRPTHWMPLPKPPVPDK